jgi:hypothetical protein
MDTNISKNSDTFIDGGGSVNRPYGAIDRDYGRESWKNMVTRFYEDVTDLFEKEGRLIRAEMNEKVTQVKTATVSFATAGVVLFIGAQCLAATAIIVLANIMPLWLSAVLVTAAFLIIGAVFLGTAKKKLNAHDLKPNKSIEAFDHIRFSLKEKVNEITKH